MSVRQYSLTQKFYSRTIQLDHKLIRPISSKQTRRLFLSDQSHRSPELKTKVCPSCANNRQRGGGGGGGGGEVRNKEERGRVEAHDGVARWTDFPPATQRRVLALMGSRGSTTCRCESQSICATSATMRDWG